MSPASVRLFESQLVVVQPTPFCNLDCGYCYLPNRAQRGLMSGHTAETLLRRVFEGRRSDSELIISFHAGEPLVAPIGFYQAFIAAGDRLSGQITVEYNFQTNGSLIDARWSRFFAETPRTSVTVSIDGPGAWHDRQRPYRSGAGSHAQVVRGIEHLRAVGKPFSALAVVTPLALAEPDRFLDYFAELGVASLGFNVEEMSGLGKASTMSDASLDQAWSGFLDRITARYLEGLPFRLRDLDVRLEIMDQSSPIRSISAHPGKIINVDWRGNVSTFSPELMGLDTDLGPVRFGQVGENPIAAMVENKAFRAIADAIAQGVNACRTNCGYFDLCGGGTPSSKYFETGSFAVGETRACRLAEQAIWDSLFAGLEARNPVRAVAGR